jgi:hypothetical protein
VNSVLKTDVLDLEKVLSDNSENNTIKDYKETLIRPGIKQACIKLSLDFQDIFLPGILNNEESQYEGYLWEARHNSMAGLHEATVIHASPPLSKINNSPWEEWYIFKGQVYHAVLYTTKKERNDGEVIIKSDDNEHPETVKGKKWYFFFDKDLKPFLLK